MPAGFAGGLDADLDQDVLGGAVLPTVVGGHSQLVHALFAVAQLLCVLDEACRKKTGTERFRAALCFISAPQPCEDIYFQIFLTAAKYWKMLPAELKARTDFHSFSQGEKKRY